MRVFDFSNQTEEKVNPECTYTTFRSNEEISTPEHPIFVLDNKEKEHAHHSAGFLLPCAAGADPFFSIH